jgi:hypothetical protein
MNNKITSAFQELRKKGYFARQNWQCCQSCGWAAVPDGKKEKVVFYHNQDKDSLNSEGECFLAWRGEGNEIVEALTKHGIGVQWDKNPNTRIKIII